MSAAVQSDDITGRLYVYVGEDGDAISVAKHGRGPNGGWMGISIARMALPSEHKTQEDLNAYAKKFAAADDLLEALEALCAALIHDHNRDLPYWRQAREAIAKATTD